MSRRGGGFLVVAALAVAAHLVVRAELDEPLPPKPAARPAAAAAPVEDYETTLRDVQRRRAYAERQAADARGIASRWSQAANYQLTYARLSGDYEGYISAEKSLDQAFRLTRAYVDDPTAGPLMMKAKLDYELHRMGPALESLTPIERQAEFFHDSALLAEAKSLRGAATFAMGEYDEGVALLREAVAIGGASHQQRLAIALEKIGGIEEAKAIWDASERSVEGRQAKAWAVFQRGNLYLEHGRYREARADLERAAAMFPGFWLIEEHIAYLDAQEGNTSRAIETYRSLVDRTGSPEFMDALAGLVDADEARELTARARAIYEERLVKLPEASYGHALDHFLVHEKDAKRALDIARKNKTLRPNGEARTKLAQALLKAGKNQEARAEIEAVLASQWQNGDTWATAATVFQRCGDAAAAAHAKEKAAELNPYAWEELDWL